MKNINFKIAIKQSFNAFDNKYETVEVIRHKIIKANDVNIAREKIALWLQGYGIFKDYKVKVINAYEVES